jgi:glutaredoxin 2
MSKKKQESKNQSKQSDDNKAQELQQKKSLNEIAEDIQPEDIPEANEELTDNVLELEDVIQETQEATDSAPNVEAVDESVETTFQEEVLERMKNLKFKEQLLPDERKYFQDILKQSADNVRKIRRSLSDEKEKVKELTKKLEKYEQRDKDNS